MSLDLSANSVIANYRVIEKIGEGGMGVVYKALDTRLEREVAIKVLPAGLTNEPDRLRRFEQEARATSALNHPNILTVYDIGNHEGSPYIVAEFLKGEELRRQMDEGPLTVRKAIDYAQQIAAGLAAAHEKGIVHRDLKPENLFVTSDGRVKILDFGLAKLSPSMLSGGANSQAETLKPITSPGVVMGTVSYMSPEQVRGQETDYRSDIFSFGVILHEMLSGLRTFNGDSTVELMNAILKEDAANLSEGNPKISPALERIVQRCLEKKPERRFQSTSDLGFALESLSSPTTTSGTDLAALKPGLASQSAKSRQRFIAAIAGLTVLGAFLVAGILAYRSSRREPAIKYEQITFRRGIVNHARFSPDGQTIIYSAEWDGKPTEIFSTRGGLTSSQSLGWKDADLLSVSSTGELAILIKRKFLGQLSYLGTLARVPMIGGTPREILEDVVEADWAPDGKDLAVVRGEKGKFRLEYPIGRVLYETRGYISYPRFSPDGTHIAFMDHPDAFDNRGSISVVDLAGKKSTLTPEFPGEEGIAWSSAGDEIWFTAGREASSLSLHGVSLRGKIREVLRIPGEIWIHDISRDGRMLLTDVYDTTDLVGKVPGEKSERNLSKLDKGGTSDLSFDGKTFLFEHWGQGSGIDYTIYLSKTDGTDPVRIGDGSAAALSPDGKWAISRLPSTGKFSLLPTGAGQPRELNFKGIEDVRGVEFFPDGKQFLIVGKEAGHNLRVYVQDLDGGPPKPITTEGTGGYLVSPDGKSFLCVHQDGVRRICSCGGNAEERILPGLTDKEVIHRWSTDGRSLLVSTYEAPVFKISRLDIATGKMTPFKELSAGDLTGVYFAPLLRLSPDGDAYVLGKRRYQMALYSAAGLR